MSTPLIKSKIYTIDDSNREIDNDNETEYKVERMNNTNPPLYALHIYEEKTLIDGFRYIKEIIYNMMDCKLFSLYKKCKDANLKVVGVKTDCVLVNNTVDEIKKTDLIFKDELGGLKIDLNKICTDVQIRHIDNELIKIKERKINVFNMVDESSDTERGEIIKKYKTLLIWSVFPGSGKSEMAKRFECKKKLFVVPFNELALYLRKCGYDVVTANKLFGINVENKQFRKVGKYDVSSYDMIVFDEVYLFNKKLLKQVDLFIKKHGNSKYIIATGDPWQNDPVGDGEDSFNHADIIDMIFENQLKLNINKRLTKQKDIKKLQNIYEDIFNENIPVIDSLKKYFKTCASINDVSTNMNITYSNEQAEIINRLLQQKILKGTIPKYSIEKDGIYYYPNMEVICKGSFLYKKWKFPANYIYKIKSINNQTLTILEEFDNVSSTLPISFISHFKLPYCRTGHSVQGKTVEEKITIFEYDHFHSSRKWIWTAITRTHSLDDVIICLDKYKPIDKYTVKHYIKNKIKGYIAHDNKARRYIKTDGYINYEWFAENLNYTECPVCQTPYEFKASKYNLSSNITADRIDNTRGHYIDNCILKCTVCNIAKANRH